MSSILLNSVIYGGVFSLLYAATLLAYRFFFHPHSLIPGPPIAKATYLYEWYYDLYLDGQFTYNLKALHKKYGTVRHLCTFRTSQEPVPDATCRPDHPNQPRRSPY